MNKIFFALIVMTSLFSLQSHSLVEFSVGYGGFASSSSGGNWTYPGATMSGAYGLTGEFRFEIPATSVGLGLRYGKVGLDISGGGGALTLDSTIYSAIFAYRFINTGILLGLVGTYGFSGTGSLKNSVATPTTAVSAGSVSSYTAGLEVGLKLPFLIALELGYGNLSMNGFSGQTIAGSSTNVSMSGIYARAGVGFNF